MQKIITGKCLKKTKKTKGYEKEYETICLKTTWINSWKYRKKSIQQYVQKIKENNEWKTVEVYVVTKFFKYKVEGSIDNDEDD